MSVATDISTARAAKENLAAALSEHPDVNGVGIQPVSGGYALIVNLLADTQDLQVPSEVDGVDVHVAITGPGAPEPA